MLSIDTEEHTTSFVAAVGGRWGKWAGGVLARNGLIYAIPALADAMLEIDPDKNTVSMFGMLPDSRSLEDKWNGGVLAPNGRIYGVPWRSHQVLELDPSTKSLSLLGQLPSSNFWWHGGVLTKSGKIIAVPYNSPVVLEIGEQLCSLGAGAPQTLSDAFPRGPTVEYALDPVDTTNAVVPVPSSALSAVMDPSSAPWSSSSSSSSSSRATFVLALMGCPESAKSSEDACFHLGHRTWHSVMITIMKPTAMLSDIRAQVGHSGLAHMPTDFCFLFRGHPLDPTVEDTIGATRVAVPMSDHLVVLIDNEHCIFGRPETPIQTALAYTVLAAAAAILGFGTFYLWRRCCASRPADEFVVKKESRRARCCALIPKRPRKSHASPEPKADAATPPVVAIEMAEEEGEEEEEQLIPGPAAIAA